MTARTLTAPFTTVADISRNSETIVFDDVVEALLYADGTGAPVYDAVYDSTSKERQYVSEGDLSVADLDRYTSLSFC